MTALAAAAIDEDQVETFQRDGIVCLRGVFRDWLEVLERGVERNIESPSTLATEHLVGDRGGRFFEDYCSWERIPEYRDFIFNSTAGAIAGALMRSQSVQIFHEHVLVKEPGTSKETPWHHDMPYYCVDGTKVISFWTALDHVPQSICPHFIVGSHRWGKLYYPRLFDDGSNYAYGDAGYETVPDVDAARDDYEIVSWSLEPGDTLAFHYLTLHGAPGNTASSRRRGFSTRWLGDDAHYLKRPGVTSPPYPDIGLSDGDRMREDWFPVVWRSDAKKTA
jgi:ectoine hydroxylase-related dioxygenase (phytanoyl-CoA dioxygenase family)